MPTMSLVASVDEGAMDVSTRATTDSQSLDLLDKPATSQNDMPQASTMYQSSAFPVTRVKSRQLACLYTKHKTQKRKVWNDGRLVLRGASARLHDANPLAGSADPCIDQCEISPAQMDSLSDGASLEMENFLVNVEGPWTGSSSASVPSSSSSKPKAPSIGMKKVLARKFQKPVRQRPPAPGVPQHCSTLAKRRRPLQPGELQRHYYGPSASQQVLAPAPSSNPPVQGHANPFAQQTTPMHNQLFRQEHSGPREFTLATSGQLSNREAWTDRRDVSHPVDPVPKEQHGTAAPSFDTGQQWSQASTSTLDGQQPVPLAQNRQQRVAVPASSIFAADSGFDPSSYYGEDESSGSDDESQGDVPVGASSFLSTSDRDAGASSTAGPHAIGSTNAPATSGTSDRISTNELLELFGGSTATTSTQHSGQSEGIDDQPATGATLLNVPEAGGQGNGSADFVLPPQDSSSDEDPNDDS